jgi:hypothetical protein
VSVTDPLAYLTAKTTGLDELAVEILESVGLTEANVDSVLTFGPSSLRPPPIVTSTTNFNWPSASTEENFWDCALANGNLAGDNEVPYVNGDVAGAAASSALDTWAKEEETNDDIDPEEGGWELDANGDAHSEVAGDDNLGAVEDEELGAGATPGVSETELWIRNSPFAADHVVAGSFETAMQVSYQAQLILVQLLRMHFTASKPTVWCRKFCSPPTALYENLSLIPYIPVTTGITTSPPAAIHKRHHLARCCLWLH